MSASPRAASRRRDRHRGRTLVKAIIVGVSIAIVIASPSAGIQLSADENAGSSASPREPELSTTTTAVASTDIAGAAVTTTIPSEDPCDGDPARCIEATRIAPVADQTRDTVASCATRESNDPQGTLTVVAGNTQEVGDRTVRYRVEVEDGLAIDGPCFADAVDEILTDARGWSTTESVTFVRVDGEAFDLRIILASPDTTDSLCAPANTAGRFSCRNRNRVVLNLTRWENGAEDFGDDIDTYRRYLVNHEVGHFLGKGHRQCPGTGLEAPVMMQQTKTVGSCVPNGWPTEDP